MDIFWSIRSNWQNSVEKTKLDPPKGIDVQRFQFQLSRLCHRDKNIIGVSVYQPLKGTVSRDFWELGFSSKNSSSLSYFRGALGRFWFLPNIRIDNQQKVGSALYDTTRNGHSIHQGMATPRCDSHLGVTLIHLLQILRCKIHRGMVTPRYVTHRRMATPGS